MLYFPEETTLIREKHSGRKNRRKYAGDDKYSDSEIL